MKKYVYGAYLFTTVLLWSNFVFGVRQNIISIGQSGDTPGNAISIGRSERVPLIWHVLEHVTLAYGQELAKEIAQGFRVPRAVTGSCINELCIITHNFSACPEHILEQYIVMLAFKKNDCELREDFGGILDLLWMIADTPLIDQAERIAAQELAALFKQHPMYVHEVKIELPKYIDDAISGMSLWLYGTSELNFSDLRSNPLLEYPPMNEQPSSTYDFLALQ